MKTEELLKKIEGGCEGLPCAETLDIAFTKTEWRMLLEDIQQLRDELEDAEGKITRDEPLVYKLEGDVAELRQQLAEANREMESVMIQFRVLEQDREKFMGKSLDLEKQLAAVEKERDALIECFTEDNPSEESESLVRQICGEDPTATEEEPEPTVESVRAPKEVIEAGQQRLAEGGK